MEVPYNFFNLTSENMKIAIANKKSPTAQKLPTVYNNRVIADSAEKITPELLFARMLEPVTLEIAFDQTRPNKTEIRKFEAPQLTTLNSDSPEDLKKNIRENLVVRVRDMAKFLKEEGKYDEGLVKKLEKEYSSKIIRDTEGAFITNYLNEALRVEIAKISENDPTESINERIDTIEKILKAGANINYQNKTGKTLLHLAVQLGHPGVVEFLIRGAGAKVNLADNNGLTALHLAAKKRDVFSEQTLLNNGAVLDLADNNGLKALHHAHMKVLKVLIDAQADVDLKDKNGFTALHHAAQAGNTLSADTLLSGEANFDLADKNGFTALHIAVKNKNELLVTALLNKKAKVDLKDKDGFTPFHLAAQLGNLDMVRVLLREEKEKAYNLIVALDLATQAGNLEVVKFLIKAGAEVGLAYQAGFTPLHLAVEVGNLKLIDALLTEENVNQTDKDGNTLLHLAAQGGHLDVINFLIEREAGVDPENEKRLTPLQLAVQNKRLNVLEAWIDNKKTNFDLTRDGLELLNFAAKNNNSDVAQFLIKKKGVDVNQKKDGSTLLHLAAEEGDSKRVEFLINKAGADANLKDDKGFTPLQLAVQNGHKDAVAALLTLKNVDQKDQDGNTLLHLAAQAGHLAVAKFLIDSRAAVNLENSNRQTPLEIAKAKDNKNHAGIVTLLKEAVEQNQTKFHIAVTNGDLAMAKDCLARGANVNLERRRSTPLEIARDNKHSEMKEFLMKAGAADEIALDSSRMEVHNESTRANRRPNSRFSNSRSTAHGLADKNKSKQP